MPAPRSGAYRMADLLAEGRLAERLAELRGQGDSYDQIARVLYVESGVMITSKTVGSWLRHLGIEAPDPAEAAS